MKRIHPDPKVSGAGGDEYTLRENEILLFLRLYLVMSQLLFFHFSHLEYLLLPFTCYFVHKTILFQVHVDILPYYKGPGKSQKRDICDHYQQHLISTQPPHWSDQNMPFLHRESRPFLRPNRANKRRKQNVDYSGIDGGGRGNARKDTTSQNRQAGLGRHHDRRHDKGPPGSEKGGPAVPGTVWPAKLPHGVVECPGTLQKKTRSLAKPNSEPVANRDHHNLHSKPSLLNTLPSFGQQQEWTSLPWSHFIYRIPIISFFMFPNLISKSHSLFRLEITDCYEVLLATRHRV